MLFKALRFAFRLTPMPQATRDQLRQRFLDRYSELVPPAPRGQSDESRRPRRPYVRADEKAIGYVPYAKGELPDPLPATLVAFYLPQFHTIPENDEWWGKGFTEWRNVTRALPQFEGHNQPRLPGDLGFYDLRDPEVMREQARLAREYGIGAFCSYFYWFGGKTLLETPLKNWLADPLIDIPLCLCWANEKWTRTWDGRGSEILMGQQHGPEDDLAFIKHVSQYMRDPRYLRVAGKPMLLVYRPGLFPDMAATAATWRAWCVNNGIGEIHLVYVQAFERLDPAMIGFDAAVEFPPNLSSPPSIISERQLINPGFAGEVLDWRVMVRQFQDAVSPSYVLYPATNPGWDNEPRRPGRGRVLQHASPRSYRDWLRQMIGKAQTGDMGSGKLIFINAWNEWAEGAVLEPDARIGYAYLQATRNALSSTFSMTRDLGRRFAILHVWHVEALDEILALLKDSGIGWHVIATTAPHLQMVVEEKIRLAGFSANTVVVENRGRDILPFLHIANRLLDEEKASVIVKLHTKRSLHRDDGDVWRSELLQRLLAGGRAGKISLAFDRQPDLGIVGPEGHILPVAPYIGNNAQRVSNMLANMGAEQTAADGVFVSGSMFWARLESLRPLLDACLFDSDFEDEAGQADGTLAHAIERIFGTCAIDSGFRIESAASICGEDEASGSVYRFANRS